MARVLITGATGLIGAQLVRRLAARHTIFATFHRSSPPISSVVTWIQHDFARPLARSALPESIETVIHLAQSRRYREFPPGAPEVLSVGVDMTAQLLSWASQSGVRRFILASTGGLYGAAGHAVTEKAAVAIGTGPLAYYFAVKRSAELLTQAYGAVLSTVIMRLFFVYGPEQSPNMLVPRLIDSVRSGRPIYLDGQNGMRLNPVYVDDVVDAIEGSLSLSGNYLINLAGPDVMTMRSIGQTIGQVLDREPRFEHRPEGDQFDVVADIGLQMRLFGIPRVGFREGITRVCESFLAAKTS